VTRSSRSLGTKGDSLCGQSSAYQVQNNLESQKLQYAMRDRLCSLGWRDIEVVDEDLGRSASGTVTRAGFRGAWLRKYAWATWARSRPERCRALHATVGMAEAGGSLSGSGHAIDRSRNGVHRRDKAMIACCWDEAV